MLLFKNISRKNQNNNLEVTKKAQPTLGKIKITNNKIIINKMILQNLIYNYDKLIVFLFLFLFYNF